MLLALLLLAQNICPVAPDAGCAPTIIMQCVAPALDASVDAGIWTDATADAGVWPDATLSDTGVHPDAAAPVDAGAGVALTRTNRTLVVGGLTRSYIEDAPAGAGAGSDFVIAFHGQTWTSDGFRSENFALTQRTNQPTIWIWMQGTGPTVIPNAEGSGTGWYPENRARDLDFANLVLASATTRFGTPRRTIAFGRSHGGGMAYDLFVRGMVDRVILTVPYLTSTVGTRVGPILIFSNDADPTATLARSLETRTDQLAAAFGCDKPWPNPGTVAGTAVCATAACGPLRICRRRDSSHTYPTAQLVPEAGAFLQGP